MDEENVIELLQRYRRDRQVLLNYILSGNLIKKVVMPPGAISLDDVDIDQVSVDYVLNCAKKGEPLDLGDAIRLFHDSLDYPYVNNTGATEEFYLLTKPEYSGPAPTREPPPVPATTPSPVVIPPPVVESEPVTVSSPAAATNLTKSQSFDSPSEKELTIDDIEDFEDDEDEFDSRRASRRHQTDASDLSLRLPLFETGITDDDLRETAYEILVAAAGASGGLIIPQKEKKKEKRHKLMRKLGRSKSESVDTHTQRQPGLVGLLETMRAQLEITESMDIRTRQGLLNAMVGKVGKRMDNILIPLELLCCISRAEFSDMKAYLRWQKRQLNMLEEGLINHPVVGFGELGRKVNELRNLFRKIEESESLPPSAAEVQRTECLRSLREVATSLSERPARGDLTGEVCHWADGYHLNVALYEKMLGSVFDILDEGKLTEEVEEILELLKSTWRILGITETVHDTCYAWVLFRQFVFTGEQGLLKVVIDHLRKIPLKEQRGPQQRLHLKSLRSSVDAEGGYQDFTFFQSFLSPVQKWVDKKLNDYHQHFSEGPSLMANVVTVAMLTRRILGEENDKVLESPDRDQIDRYITSSVKSAFLKMAHSVEFKADATHEPVLATLAEETKKLLKKDTTIFTPVLSKWHPQAAVVSASLIHKLYGNKLRPFLEHAEHLTEDVVSVFPASDALEQHIMSVMASVAGDDGLDSICRQKIASYQIENKSGTLVLRWVNGQLERIETWIKRAADQEVWDPISPQQRHGSSIVEVYRIIEETTDQFFAFKVPMRDGELNSLWRGLDKAFQVYTQLVTTPLVDKEDLVPPVPVLTRHKKELGIKAFVKKEVQEVKTVDERKVAEITQLTIPKLCVRLNSLYYGISQLSKLEDGINERWARKKTENINIRRLTHEKSKSAVPNQKNQFDGSRREINCAIDRLCEFTGMKVIFWDLQQPFIDNLYRNNVPQARLETITEVLDLALNQLCDVIVEQLRDRVVTGLLQASLDGLLRVILDGGSTRVFSPNDAPLLEDDLETLKEFFIAGGDGLPRGTVENLVSRVRPVINLIKQETRVLIDDLREVTHGGKSKFGTDSKTLLRVLCHRNDSEASHYVKKHFKIPSSAPSN
ncbi:protein unc-13 homolog isoform X2 [Panicum virgatum]|uniref:protein unc-13 homolog isoform X2 n=1 Tax=Panicum virgatum TaxID=38727 RepID=UPI0019D5B299|nr:protein unc-13 homolog isoform X2 [Panicum virgatum]XP_039795959.1 protein unc-13 homolog isoform X2 [Panicum virgatum]